MLSSPVIAFRLAFLAAVLMTSAHSFNADAVRTALVNLCDPAKIATAQSAQTGRRVDGKA
jgi:hypothetical protein